MKAKHPLAPFFRRGLGVGVERFLKCCRPVQPHLNLTCLNAEPDDPEEFSQQVKLVCQLYEDAPALSSQGVHLISTDEMTGIQALQRAYPSKPMRPAQVELIEFEYIRHGLSKFDCQLGGSHRKGDSSLDWINPHRVRLRQSHC